MKSIKLIIPISLSLTFSPMNVSPDVLIDILVKSGCCTTLLMIVSKLCISLAERKCIIRKEDNNLSAYSGDCDSVALCLHL